MKYIITRSSSWSDNPKIDGAVKELIHRYDYRIDNIRNRLNVWNEFCERCRDIIVESDGGYRGTCKEPVEVWVVEITDLHEFVKRYGTIILFEPDNEEGFWKVEIYDDYRE